MLEAYRQHVADRAAQNIPLLRFRPSRLPTWWSSEEAPAGEEAFLIER